MDAGDVCSASASSFHTYTPKLHNVVSNIVLFRYGAAPPPLFLPGVKNKSQDFVVKPPPPLEAEWVSVDDDKTTLDELVKSQLSTTAQYVDDADDVESPQSAELRELAINPAAAEAVAVDDGALQIERQRARAAFTKSKELEFIASSSPRFANEISRR